MLDLSHNAIPELPAEVGQLMQLKKLYLDDNRLRTLPCELHKLSTTLISAPARRPTPPSNPANRSRRPTPPPGH